MQTMRESWTDERLDDLNERAAEGFERADKRFDKLEARIEDLQEETARRFEAQNRVMVMAVIALSSAYMAGFAALVTQI